MRPQRGLPPALPVSRGMGAVDPDDAAVGGPEAATVPEVPAGVALIVPYPRLAS